MGKLNSELSEVRLERAFSDPRPGESIGKFSIEVKTFGLMKA
jgi:hypothetical protein